MTLSCWVPGFEVQLSQPSMSSSSSLRLPNPRLLNCTMAWSSCSQGATQGAGGCWRASDGAELGFLRPMLMGALPHTPVPAGSYQACLSTPQAS